MVLSLAFILALVMSAIVLLIGIVIFSEVVEAMEITLPAGITSNQTEGKFYGIEGGSAPTLPLQVHEINKTAWSTNQTTIISSINISGLGFTTTGVNGLARDPTDGTFYGVAKDQANATNRRLISIDPVTGVGVDIGGMGEKFVTLGINADGTLRTITGLGAITPFEFHSVDKTTGQTTLLCTFVVPAPISETVGSLAFNSKDGFMYWLTGFRDDFQPRDNMSLLRIDNQSTCAFTVIPESGLTSFLAKGTRFFEIIGLTYSPTDDLFYGTVLNSQTQPASDSVPPCNSSGAITSCRVTYNIDTSGVFTNLNWGSFPSLKSNADVKSLSFELAGGGTIFTPTEQSQVDTFENAKAIGFTVIGILPVALFFALFSIFSGRFE